MLAGLYVSLQVPFSISMSVISLLKYFTVHRSRKYVNIQIWLTMRMTTKLIDEPEVVHQLKYHQLTDCKKIQFFSSSRKP